MSLFLLIYCDQFVAPEIHNSRRYCSIQLPVRGQDFD